MKKILFDEMNKKGYEPSVIIYHNFIMNHQCKIGNTSMALQLPRKMEPKFKLGPV